MFAPRRGKRVGLSRKMIRNRFFNNEIAAPARTRSAEDKDKRRKFSCTRCAVPCAGCAMDEAQRKVRARSASTFFSAISWRMDERRRAEMSEEAQGRDERGGAGPRRARRHRAEMSEEAQGRDGRGPSGDESTIERAAGWHHGAATPLNEQFTRFQHQQSPDIRRVAGY